MAGPVLHSPGSTADFFGVETADQVILEPPRPASRPRGAQHHIPAGPTSNQPATGGLSLPALAPSRRRFFSQTGRTRRVLMLLAGVWALSAFDLGFTLHQAPAKYFTEMNPVAALLLDGPPVVVVVYKFGLLGVGSAILYWLRRHSIAELACWFLLTACFYVTVRWYVYYRGVLALGAGVQLEELPM